MFGLNGVVRNMGNAQIIRRVQKIFVCLVVIVSHMQILNSDYAQKGSHWEVIIQRNAMPAKLLNGFFGIFC